MSSFEELFGPPLERENKIESVDQRTLAFAREHIDVLELGHFDPEWELGEIKKIYQAVREDQRHGVKTLLMENFKKKLAQFRKNMSDAQLVLESFLRTNPDASQQEMLSTVDAILEKYEGQSQEGHFYEAVDKFRQARLVVKNVVKQYQEQFADHWPAELFKKLFGRFPNGRLIIDILPIGLYFKINDMADYALAFGEDIDQSKTSGGRTLAEVPAMPELSGKILLENSSTISIKDWDYSRVSRVHEEEHAIHRSIYPLAIFSTKRKLTDNFFELRGDFNVAVLRDALKNMVGLYVDMWERSAKGEILAYLKDGHNLRNEEVEADFFAKDGLYHYLNQSETDFFSNGVEKLWQEAKGHLQIKKADGAEINANELKFIASATIREAWRQYQRNLARALKVVSFFLEKYGEEKRLAVLRLLSQEPLNKWHRLKRLLSS